MINSWAYRAYIVDECETILLQLIVEKRKIIHRVFASKETVINDLLLVVT